MRVYFWSKLSLYLYILNSPWGSNPYIYCDTEYISLYSRPSRLIAYQQHVFECHLMTLWNSIEHTPGKDGHHNSYRRIQLPFYYTITHITYSI